MDANFLRPSTEQIDADTDLIMFQPTEIIGEQDLYTKLSGYELESEKQLSKRFKRKPTTILDESLGSILGKTFSFVDMSGDEYMKKYYKAVSTLHGEDKNENKQNKVLSHMLAMGMYITDNDNSIYLGILFVFVSVIIYFMSIVS